jgi:thiamine pyrophosphate-dependent acetolactate synthase large subunit-like protein
VREQPKLERRAAVAAILADRANALIVTGLGKTTYDVATAGDHPLNFPMWGAMGGAAMVGLGLALAQPTRRVVVITGDGEMMMGLGSLATIAVSRPQNLTIITVDNEYYAETGMQPSHTGRGVDLATIARGAGFPVATTIREEGDLQAWIPRLYADPGPLFAVMKVMPNDPPASARPQSGAERHYRFRAAVLGTELPADPTAQRPTT